MIKHFLAAITGNMISLIGTLMIILSLLFIGALLIMQAMGFQGGAYLGIITFVGSSVSMPMAQYLRKTSMFGGYVPAPATKSTH